MAKSFFAVSDTKVENNSVTTGLGAFQPRFSEGDHVLLFSREYDDLIFHSEATITTTREETEKQTEKTRQVAELSQPKRLPGRRSLAVLAGSLRKVYRHLTPNRHFQRGVARLEEEDYDTIVEGTPDVARTVFKYLFSALPLQVQADFVAVKFDPTALSPDGVIEDYKALSGLLLDYYEENVAGFVGVVTGCERAFRSLKRASNVPPLSKLVLHDVDTRQSVQLGILLSQFGELAQSALFKSNDNQPRTLLAEAREQLKFDQSNQHTKAREWNETIF